MNTRLAGLMCISLLFLAVPLSAQDKPVEFGIDGGLSIIDPDQDGADDVTILGIPNLSLVGQTSVRVGFFASPRVSIESAVAFTRISGDDNSTTTILLFPSVLYHFKDFGRIPLPYVRVGAGLSHQRASWDGDSESETQFVLGGGVGVKIPFAKNAFFRLEGGIDKWIERGSEEDWEDWMPGFKAIRLSAGISAILN